MKNTVGILLVCIMFTITVCAAAETPVEIKVDPADIIRPIPTNLFSTCKYNTDSLLQEKAREARFPLIRIDALIDGIEGENDDDSPSHFNWDGFWWGSGAAQYGADLDEAVQQMIANGHKPFIILHRTQTWNAADDWRSVPLSIDEWAEAAAAAVYHFNIELNAGIEYWEIWNEPNGSYEWNGSFDDYLKLARAAALRMKENDPTIKVGGPALSYADLGQMQKAIKEMWDVFDFYSWHAYGTGGDDSAKITDAALLSQTGSKYGTFAKQLRASIDRYDKSGKKKELILSEFNIDWAGTAKGESRRMGVVNAIWTVSVLGHLMRNGVDAANIFSLTECSILGDAIKPPPVFDAYKLIRSNMGDRLVKAESGNRSVEVIASINADTLFIWLINKGQAAQTARLRLASVPNDGNGIVARLPEAPDQSTTIRYKEGNVDIFLPKESITVYQIRLE